MPIESSKLKDLILKGIPDAEVRIEDLRGDGSHYAAYISSPAFAGKTRIEQHRMVHKAVEGHDLDALAIQTSVPEE